MTDAQTDAREERGNQRLHPRLRFGNRITGLIQALLADPVKVADQLESDLRRGADQKGIAALLEAARVFGNMRGVDLVPRIRDVHSRLKKAGCDLRA